MGASELEDGSPVQCKNQTNWSSFDHSSLPDVRVLVVEDREFTVLAPMLGLYSSFMCRLFYGDFKEASQSVITLEEVKADVFEEFLNAIYPCHLPLTERNSGDMVEMLHRFDVPYLVPKAEGLMFRAVNGRRLSAFVPITLALQQGTPEKCERYALMFSDISHFLKENKSREGIDDMAKIWIFGHYERMATNGPPGHLATTPSDKLILNGPFDTVREFPLKLSNTSPQSMNVSLCIKNDDGFISVNPNSFSLAAKESISVTVIRPPLRELPAGTAGQIEIKWRKVGEGVSFGKSRVPKTKHITLEYNC